MSSIFAFKAPAAPNTVETHTHFGNTCPITGKGNGFCPAQAGDKRSPCPALNALANHGYLPRDGKKVPFFTFVSALRRGYGLTLPFSLFLSLGTFYLLKRWPQPIDLDELAEHNRIEHDASLVHPDTNQGEAFAPLHTNERMLNECMTWMTTNPAEGANGSAAAEQEVDAIQAEDVARARVNREKRSMPLDNMHSEIARGEMAIALLVFSNPSSLFKGARWGVPKEWFREWLSVERMPQGGTWRPTNKGVGLFATMGMSKSIRTSMGEQRDRLGENARPGVLWDKGVRNLDNCSLTEDDLQSLPSSTVANSDAHPPNASNS